jgi:hypothetical protein
MVEISDMTARLVLGDGNLEEWQHARFVSTLEIVYWFVPSLYHMQSPNSVIFFCSPHKGCNEPFDAKDVVPAPEGVSHDDSLVQVSCYARHVIDPCFFNPASVSQMQAISVQAMQSPLA